MKIHPLGDNLLRTVEKLTPNTGAKLQQNAMQSSKKANDQHWTKAKTRPERNLRSGKKRARSHTAVLTREKDQNSTELTRINIPDEPPYMTKCGCNRPFPVNTSTTVYIMQYNTKNDRHMIIYNDEDDDEKRLNM